MIPSGCFGRVLSLSIQICLSGSLLLVSFQHFLSNAGLHGYRLLPRIPAPCTHQELESIHVHVSITAVAQAFAAFDTCIARFMEGNSEADDKRRHNTFKLIPKVTKGSWVIRNAVGSTPVLLGKKLTTKYFRSGAALQAPSMLQPCSSYALMQPMLTVRKPV